MPFKQIFKIYKRLLELGPTGVFYRIKNRTQKKLFAFKFKNKALKKKANHSWRNIQKKYTQSKEFSVFFQKLKEHPSILRSFDTPDFAFSCVKTSKNILCSFSEREKATTGTQDEEWGKHNFLQKADLFTNNCFEILGKKICFDGKINWQSDWKTKKQAKTWGQQLSYFTDIKIDTSNQKPMKYYPDIKVPWELSRFQHLYFLGQAYNFSKNSKYAQTFQGLIESWIDDNPYLLGVNWVCPMEVAIRAINFIWGFCFFKDCTSISINFWQKLVCSLYDHLIYLENNWEESDKPNNHYLSDLLGYFYLTLFFQDFKNFNKKQNWIIKKILEQFDKQIQKDGTSHEGSTSYHKLVTEIFLHFKILCESKQILLPQNFYKKFNRMLLFLQDCSDSSGNFVQIGDNDSGRIVNLDIHCTLQFFDKNTELKANNEIFNSTVRPEEPTQLASRRVSSNGNLIEPFGKPLRPFDPSINSGLRAQGERSKSKSSKLNQTPKQKIVTHYKHFGLTIIKTNNWHITFRHPTFNKTQPSGHFHQNELSVTLSIDGIPILVDPGTYLYTASKFWRNFFRNKENHNVFYASSHKESLEQGLFQLSKDIQQNTEKIQEQHGQIIISNHHQEKFRKIIFDPQKKSLRIEDEVISDKFSHSNSACWNFIFHPNINLIQKSKNVWLAKKENMQIAQIETNLNLKKVNGFYSKGYGILEKCNKLSCRQTPPFKKVQTTFQKFN